MIDKKNIPYEKCVFVCVNDNHGEKPSCGDHRGEEVFRKLREIAKERGLHPRIRVTQAKCLGQCATGTTVMIYPDNVWFSGIDPDNMAEILPACFGSASTS
jgi:(2Fe-2S) ferredoxin